MNPAPCSSAGVVLYVLCWGRLPFSQRGMHTEDPSTLFAAIQEEPLVIPTSFPAISSSSRMDDSSNSCSGTTWEAHQQGQWWCQVVQLQRRLLQKEPSQRLQLREALCHPWLAAPPSWRQVVM